MGSQISPTGTGWALHSHVLRGSVNASEFAEWWLVEEAMAAMMEYVLTTFHGSALVERHGLHARYVAVLGIVIVDGRRGGRVGG